MLTIERKIEIKLLISCLMFSYLLEFYVCFALLEYSYLFYKEKNSSMINPATKFTFKKKYIGFKAVKKSN